MTTRHGILSSSILAFFTLIFLSGCSKDQLLIEVYTAPKEASKVEKMVNSGQSKDGAFLLIGINPEVRTSKSDGKAVKKYLVSDIQEMLTQSNFIALHPIYEDAKITLDMEVVNYTYNETYNSVKADLGVDFIIMNGATKLFSKTYSTGIKLQSRSGRGALDSKSTVLAKMSKKVARKFAKDITPIRTKKLVELMSLPSELEYTITMAKAGNFQSAIDMMEKYQDDKEMEFYFNLAIYYEGLAAKSGNYEFLEKANENYDKAIATGGAEDEMVMREKSKFDQFYRIVKKILEQQASNSKKTKKINEEYEIVE